MRFRNTIGATALVAALMMMMMMMMIGGAAAFDDTKYPDLKGQWRRAGNAGLLAGGAGGFATTPASLPASAPPWGRNRR